MEDILLIIIAILSAYYIYKKLFVNNSCSCGNNNCPSKRKNDK